MALLETLPSLFRDYRILGHRNFQHVPIDSQMPRPASGGIKSKSGYPLFFFFPLYMMLQTAASQETSTASRCLENEVQPLSVSEASGHDLTVWFSLLYPLPFGPPPALS